MPAKRERILDQCFVVINESPTSSRNQMEYIPNVGKMVISGTFSGLSLLLPV